MAWWQLAAAALPYVVDAFSGSDSPSGAAPPTAIGALGAQSGKSNTGALLANRLDEILGQSGRTSPDLFNRILAGSSRGTASAQANLASRGARSGIDSGIQDALNAAIEMEGLDRETGIRATEASLAEDRRRSDTSLVNQNLISPLLQEQGIRSGVSISNNQIAAQQGNQNLQAIATFLGGLASSCQGSNSSNSNSNAGV